MSSTDEKAPPESAHDELPSPERTSWRDALRRNWPAAAASLALVVAHGYDAAFVGNQHTYLLRSVAGAEGGALESDPLVRSVDPTPVFTAVVRPLMELFGAPVVPDLLWPLVALVFFGSLWLVTGRHAGRRNDRLLLWTAGMALVVAPGAQKLWSAVTDRINGLPQPSDLVAGVAHQYALGPYLQPSAAAVLAVLGAAVATRRPGRLRGVALPIGTATVMLAVVLHPSFAVGAGLLVMALVLAELWGRRSQPRTALASALRGVVPALLIGGVALLSNLDPVRGLGGPEGDAANAILVRERLPMHALPGEWFSIGSILAIAVVAAASRMSLRSEAEPERRLGRFLAVGGVLTGVVSVAVWIVDRPVVSLSFPWRSSVVLVPLATSYLLARLAHRLSTETEESGAARLGLKFVSVVVIVASMLSGYRSTQDSDDSTAMQELSAELRDLEPAGVGMVPTHLGDLRLDAGVAILADRENHPVESAAVVEWWHDLGEIDAAMEDPERFCELVDTAEVAWVVIDLDLAHDVQDTCLAEWSFRAAGGMAIASVQP